jgi:hypothetical protein
MSTPTSVIQQFLHPPVGLMRAELIAAGPFSSDFTLSRPRGPIGTDAFGFRWLVVQAPGGYGTTQGPGFLVFDRVVLQVAVVHQLLDGSTAITAELATDRNSGFFLFNESLPLNVHCIASPGVFVDMSWLVVL